MRLLLLIVFIFCLSHTNAQTLGGSATFNFLKLPATPLLTASGGVNVSYASTDVGLAANNPAMFAKDLHSQLAMSFNSFFAGAKAYTVSGAYHHEAWNTTIGAQIFFIDYGSIPQTDPAGTEVGTFRPKDLVVQVSAAKTYLQKWQYGVNLKFIQSNYGAYRSSGIAADAGLFYNDSAALFSAGLVAKNMGTQLTTYSGSAEDLPFDLQAGFTKKLRDAPFAFSVTAQQLHQFNTVYNDSVFNAEAGYDNTASFGNKLFNHFVFATHIYIGANLQATIGYNRLRRNELNLGSSGNGLNGFSAGFSARFNKLHFQYARAYFGRGHAYNQFGIHLQLDQLTAVGKL